MSKELNAKIRSALDDCLGSVETAEKGEISESRKKPAVVGRSSEVMLSKSSTWSRQRYIERVRSFKPQFWFLKPELLSPLEVARFGFVAVGLDTLECISCKVRVIHRPLDICAEEAEDSVTTTHDSLVTSHADYCPWKTASCPASFVRPPTDLRSLVERSRSFDLLVANPVINLSVIPPVVKEKEFSLRRTLWSSRNVRILSLLNWRVGECGDTLECSLCGRIVGIWNFRCSSAMKNEKGTKEVSDRGWENDLEIDDKSDEDAGSVRNAFHYPGAKRRRLSEDGAALTLHPRKFMQTYAEKSNEPAVAPADDVGDGGGDVDDRPLFDPMAEHRWFCFFCTGPETQGPNWSEYLQNLVQHRDLHRSELSGALLSTVARIVEPGIGDELKEPISRKEVESDASSCP